MHVRTILLVVLCLLPTVTHQQPTTVPDPPTPAPTHDLGVCISQVSGQVTVVDVEKNPPFNIDVLYIDGTHRHYQFTCIKVNERLPTLSASQVGLCEVPALIHICYAFVSTPDDWVCKAHDGYQKTAKTHVIIGSEDAEEKKFKVQWSPPGRADFCFPNELTSQMVGAAIVPMQSDLTANIIFIIVVCILAFVFGFFLFYQLRKVMRKWWQKSKTRPATHLTEEEHQNTLKAIGIDVTPPRKVDANGNEVSSSDEEMRKDGVRRWDDREIVLTEYQHRRTDIMVNNNGETVEVESTELPRPWHKRFNYDQNTPGRKQRRLEAEAKEREKAMRKEAKQKKKKGKKDSDDSSDEEKEREKKEAEDKKKKEEEEKKKKKKKEEESKKKDNDKGKKGKKDKDDSPPKMKKPDNGPIDNTSMRNYPPYRQQQGPHSPQYRYADKRAIQSIRYDETTPVRNRIPTQFDSPGYSPQGGTGSYYNQPPAAPSLHNSTYADQLRQDQLHNNSSRISMSSPGMQRRTATSRYQEQDGVL